MLRTDRWTRQLPTLTFSSSRLSIKQAGLKLEGRVFTRPTIQDHNELIVQELSA